MQICALNLCPSVVKMNIAYQKSERFGVLTVLVDGDPWREIHTHIFGRKPTLHITCNDLADFPLLEYRAAMAYALKRLALKNQASMELSNSLEERLVSSQTIDRILSECKQLGYLNDSEWVEAFIRRQMAKKLGPQAILMKLKAKGIPSEIYQEILPHLDNTDLQKQRIQHLLDTKYRSKDLSDYKTRAKVIASLARKGYPLSEIYEIIGSQMI